ncbi:MAG: AsmA family protein, partial [Muribaculaceae bacterium]|nr:AsmA family protein [Muribaculaceae bacterium]
MTRSYKILRAFLMVLVILAVVIPMFLYVALSLPVFQRQLVTVAQRELTHLLGARVDIGALSIAPFNRILLRDISVSDNLENDTILRVERLGAGINIYELIRHRNIIINYAEIVGLDASINRDSLSSPLNLQPIIDRLQSKDKRQSAPFSMAINTVLMRNCHVTYDVKNIPYPPAGVFSPHHVEISDLSSDLLLPVVGNEGGHAVIKRLRIKETSGLEISSLSGSVKWQPGKVSWHDISIVMPRSELIASNGQWGDTLLIGLNTGSHIFPGDLAPFAPILSRFHEPINLTTTVSGTLNNDLSVKLASRTSSRDIELALNAIIHSPLDTIERELKEMKADITVLPSAIIPLLDKTSPTVKQIAEKAGKTEIVMTGNVNTNHGMINADIKTSQGKVKVSGNFEEVRDQLLSYSAGIEVDNLNLGQLLSKQELNKLSMTASSRGVIINRQPEGTLTLEISNLDWNNHPISGVTGTLESRKKRFDLSLNSQDPAVKFDILANGELLAKNKELNITSRISRLDLGELFPESNAADRVASLELKTDLRGSGIDDINGTIEINDILLSSNTEKDISLKGVFLESSIGENGFRTIRLNSDIVDGSVSGTITPSRLKDQMLDLLTMSIPSLRKEDQTSARYSRVTTEEVSNDFTCQFT